MQYRNMSRAILKVFIVLVVLLYCCDGQSFEGEPCSKKGAPGACVNIRKCQSAIEEIRKRITPQICGFSGSDPIVCCPGGNPVPTTSKPQVATTSTRRTTRSTTEYVPPVYDYYGGGGQECAPLSASLTAPRNGKKAWDKCIDYQEQLVYPCEKGVALTGEKARSDRCGHAADELIVGGVDAARNEFPHMAMLGYGDTPATLQWLCGGTIISDRFVLTAGHCTTSRDVGDVTYVAVNKLSRSEQVPSSRLYRVQRIIRHPSFKPPLKYNDIALLQTATPITLDQFTVPACLHTGETVNDERAIATGWGAIEYRGDNADRLQKVILTKFKREECNAQFPVSRNMPRGVDHTTQVCYGDYTKSKDTCQGDSGGPLQTKNKRLHCMYTVVGVTSFGKACGFAAEPGIYTKVAPFVGWIEGIVWP